MKLYYNSGYENVIKLRNGNFNKIKIDFWFKEGFFGDILAVIVGCNKQENYSVLNFISKYAFDLLTNFNITDNSRIYYEDRIRKFELLSDDKINEMTDDSLKEFWNKIIIDFGIRIIFEVIEVCGNHPELDEYQLILKELEDKYSEFLKIYDKSDYIKSLIYKLELDELSILTSENREVYDNIGSSNFIKTIMPNLKNWFKRYFFKYILRAVDECDSILNADILNFIYVNTQNLYNNSNIYELDLDEIKEVMKNFKTICRYECFADDDKIFEFFNSVIKSECEIILTRICEVAIKHSNYYGFILDELCKSPSENVRLLLSGRVDINKLSFFKNDMSQRISKICYIRSQFEDKWQILTDIDKKKIEYLTNALIYGVIDIFIYENHLIHLSSQLFERPLYLEDFDIDLIGIIDDKRILASIFFDYIKEGTILLREDLVPSYFFDIKKYNF